jgi:hypothetical protein
MPTTFKLGQYPAPEPKLYKPEFRRFGDWPFMSWLLVREKMMCGERKPVASPAFHFGFPTLLPPPRNPRSTRRPEQYRRYSRPTGKSLYKQGPFGINSCCRTQECRPAGNKPGLSPMSIKRCRLLPVRTIAVPPQIQTEALLRIA